MKGIRIFLTLGVVLEACHGSVYLPGVSPHSYKQDEDVCILHSPQFILTLTSFYQISLYVSKLTSTTTQIPYDYYSLDFCRPKHEKEQSENLGEVLSGDRIENSVYKVKHHEFLVLFFPSLFSAS
jgi:hypothetical protein